MKELTGLFTTILDEVDKRLPNVTSQIKLVQDAISKGGDWRKIEDAGRLHFRLNQLSLNKEAAQLLEAAEPAEVDFNVLERIISTNELLPVSYLYKGAVAARTVGRVNIRTASRGAGYGTGFMVSPRLMLTNHHVLENSDAARYSLVEMNYRETLSGVSDASLFRLLPDDFFVANAELDFALVAVEMSNQKGDLISNYGFNKIIRESGKALVGEHVNIIQHPSAEPKQIAVRQNKIIGKVGNFLHYVTDTQKGSSGSPVFNDSWDLVALHHAGKPKRNSDGRIMLLNGSAWDGSPLTKDQIAWEANEGVRISQIINYLETLLNGMDESHQHLYEQIFSSQPPASNSLTEFSLGSTNNPQIVTEPDGSTSIYMRVNLASVSNNGVSALGSSSGQPSPIATPAIPVTTATPTDSSNANRASVIVSNADNENPEYYNPQTDEADKQSYYQGLDFTGSSDELFQACSKLVKNTHKKVLSYRTARLDYLYPVVDRHEFGRLRNIYSGTPLDPEEVIRQELDLIDRYDQEFNSILRSESFTSEADREEALDALEASLPFNCEHVVPQSWFNKRNPMRADLHHLFTCEPGCNSFRSNIPYWQFSPIDEAVRSQCGRRESDKFEPENGHGSVARATLYFLLRYPQQIGNAGREMQSNRLKILLDWHKRYPVDRYELHRNASIFAVQGNRNPLIDFPELAKKVKFSLGFG